MRKQSITEERASASASLTSFSPGSRAKHTDTPILIFRHFDPLNLSYSSHLAETSIPLHMAGIAGGTARAFRGPHEDAFEAAGGG